MKPSTLTSLALALAALLLASCQRETENFMVGTLERDRIELKVESSEPIVSIDVRDGQAVIPGDLVLTQARANLEATRVQRDNARADLERTREVFARGLSSQGQLDRDETAYKTAVAREQAAVEALERLLNGTTVEELQQAEAALAAAEAQVRAAELDLERTRIVAPVAGTVDKVLYQLGERPAAGTTIAVLLDNSRTFARVYVPEHLRARIKPGVRLEVRIDGSADRFDGRVRWVSADASFTPYFALTEHDRSRLSYLAEIDLEGADALPAGIPLQVDFVPAD
jgi:HlyD family secretion protein